MNLQPPEHWIAEFAKHGYRLAEDIDFLRDIARRERADSFFAQSGLVFLKAENTAG